MFVVVSATAVFVVVKGNQNCSKLLSAISQVK